MRPVSWGDNQATAYSARLTTREEAPRSQSGRSELLAWVHRLLVLFAGVAAVLLVAPEWGSALLRQAGENGATSSLQATAWVEAHVPRKDVVVVDDYLWLDLKRAGMNPLWEQKMASDSETEGELPDGWRSVDYVVVTGQIIGTVATLPILQQAIEHSVPVASFGDGIVVRRVNPGGQPVGPGGRATVRSR